MPLYHPGDEPIPGYRLVEQLGEGGSGEVWKARAPGGVEAALKFIRLSGGDNRLGRKEFRSLRLMKRVRHANLVPIHAIWLVDSSGGIREASPEAEKWLEDTQRLSAGDPAAQVRPALLVIAMGLGDKSLKDRLDDCERSRERAIPVRELMKYMEGAAAGIDFLNARQHELGGELCSIHHGDIKPRNLLITGGAAQVCDFGLARLFDAHSTERGFTLHYAAPETLQNQSPHRSTDQYALAVSYCELRTGELPFREPRNPAAVMYAHLHGALDFSKLPEAERRVIARATATSPGDRYESCSEMAEALSQVRRELEIEHRNARKRRLMIAATVSVILGVVFWHDIMTLTGIAGVDPGKAPILPAALREPIRREIPQDPPEPTATPRQWLDFAINLLRQDQDEQALEVFSKLLAENPEGASGSLPEEDLPRLLLGHARAAARMGQWNLVDQSLPRLQAGTADTLSQPELAVIALLARLRDEAAGLAAADPMATIDELLPLMDVLADVPSEQRWEWGKVLALRHEMAAAALRLPELQAPLSGAAAEERRRQITARRDLFQQVVDASFGPLGQRPAGEDEQELRGEIARLEAVDECWADVQRLQQPGELADVAAVLDLLSDRLPAIPDPGEVSAICLCLAELALTDGSSDRMLTRGVLALLESQSADGLPALKAGFVQLAIGQLKWLLRQPGTPQWDELGRLASNAQRAGARDPLVGCVLLECKLEQLGSSARGLEFDNALSGAATTETLLYAHYLRARLLRADADARERLNQELDAAIGALVEERDELSLFSESSYRAALLAELLFTTAQHRWFAAAPENIEQAVRGPFGLLGAGGQGAPSAVAAHRWLSVAARLSAELRGEHPFQLYNLLAAACAGDREAILRSGAAVDLQSFPVVGQRAVKYENVALHCAIARVQALPGGKQAAFERLLAVLRDLSAEGVTAQQERRHLYQFVLDPTTDLELPSALRLGDELWREARSEKLAYQLAELRALQGQLLWRSRLEDFGFDVFSKIDEAYGHAIELVEMYPRRADDRLPSYLFHRGQAAVTRLELVTDSAKLNDVMQWAQRANTIYRQRWRTPFRPGLGGCRPALPMTSTTERSSFANRCLTYRLPSQRRLSEETTTRLGT
jgi:serine/threonine protein kinase